jgi:hypothetical protein
VTTAIFSDLYMVHQTKSKVVFNLPIGIAFFVYAYAKRRMLQFYYSFLLPCLGKENFELVYMDTDSLYFACSEETLREAAPDKRKFDNLAPDYLEGEETKMVPGLFKLECHAEKIVALNSKTYYAKVGLGEDGLPVGPDKLSHKGVSKRTNDLTYDHYFKVLFPGEDEDAVVMGKNTGFRMHRGDIKQYEQHKIALTSIYVKRIVADDRTKTRPLDL